MGIVSCNTVEGRRLRAESERLSFPRSAWERTSPPLRGRTIPVLLDAKRRAIPFPRGKVVIFGE